MHAWLLKQVIVCILSLSSLFLSIKLIRFITIVEQLLEREDLIFLDSKVVNACTNHHFHKSSSVSILAALSKLVYARNLSMILNYDSENHWIGKDDQGRCGGCNWRTWLFCEKCNISVHPECINAFFTRAWGRRVCSILQ